MAKKTPLNDMKQDECGHFRFTDQAVRDTYDRHVVFDLASTLEHATQCERFEAVARSLRDLLTHR